tara:strand:+ start:669 stop:968 length:300 start_codon:yes stop_codon:yes gene_type:complete
MSKFKVGDKVRILHTDYQEQGLKIGDVHKVVAAYEVGIELSSADSGYLYFYDKEVELVLNSTLSIETPEKTQYIRILESLAGENIVAQARKISEALKDA